MQMYSTTSNTILIFVLYVFNVAYCIEPITIGLTSGVALGISVGLAGYQQLKCLATECCQDPWLTRNISGLKDSLDTQLHGQHLVKTISLRSLSSHLHLDRHPNKALVLSFHGWTGSGKNFVSRLIADHLYAKGMSSKYVHLFIATHHFPHVSRVETYKEQLRDWIRTNVSVCARSMFIFDEMDKMPPGLLEAITPYIDHHPDINGIDYRRSIFIFLSNTGGQRISEHTLQHLAQGLQRSDLSHKELERILVNSAYNHAETNGDPRGGLWHSSLIEKHLINAYVPFLPMEKEHVRLCVRDDLISKGQRVTTDLVSRVVDELEYSPYDLQLFSTSGCKRVSQKVDFVLEELETFDQN